MHKIHRCTRSFFVLMADGKAAQWMHTARIVFPVNNRGSLKVWDKYRLQHHRDKISEALLIRLLTPQ